MGLKSKARRSALRIESTDKAGDMLTKSIHKDFRKTAAAECSFFHGRSKLASRGGPSELSLRQLSSRKMQEHFFLRKVTVTSFRTSERRSRCKRNKWKGPACGKEAVYAGLLLDLRGAFWSPNATLPTNPLWLRLRRNLRLSLFRFLG